MKIPDPIFIGFFPKKTVQNPDFLDGVDKICSVSNCISPGPDDWIDKWKHNPLGFFDSQKLAIQVVGGNRNDFDIFAYRLFPLEFVDGEVRGFEIPSHVDACLDSFTFLGYDATNRSGGSFFECSALSCNYAAKDFPVNRHCLFDDMKVAYEATRKISSGDYEPGPWYLLEVHRKTKGKNGRRKSLSRH